MNFLIKLLYLFIGLSLLSACSNDGPLGNQAVSFSSSRSSLLAEDGSEIACKTEADISAVTSSYACLYEKRDFQGEVCCVPRPTQAKNIIRVPAENPRSIATGSLRVRGSEPLVYCSTPFSSYAEYEACMSAPQTSTCPSEMVCTGIAGNTDLSHNSSSNAVHFGVRTLSFGNLLQTAGQN